MNPINPVTILAVLDGEKITKPNLYGAKQFPNKKPSKHYPTLVPLEKYKSKSQVKRAFEQNKSFKLKDKLVNKQLLHGAGVTRVNVQFDNKLMVLEVK